MLTLWLLAATTLLLLLLPADVGAASADAAAHFAERMALSQNLRRWIPVCGVALLILERVLQRREPAARLGTGINLCLGGLVLATLFAWWTPYRGELDTWLHEKDAFHYYVGGKYFSELDYHRLYTCSIVADAEDGHHRLIAGSQIRDLHNEEPIPTAAALQNPDTCKRHFSPARWIEFKHDVAYFRSRASPLQWRQARGDHGYNPPPTWTLLGGFLASTGPASDSQLRWLSALDPALLCGLFASLVWAFGWRVAGLAFLFWGTNQIATWEWVGGSLLRYDWLVASIVGICCLRRDKPIAAGLLIAWAAGVRMFPLAIAGGVGLSLLLSLVRGGPRSIEPAQVRFTAALCAGFALIGLLTSIAPGPGSWVEFGKNSKTHLGTDSVNRVGLRPLLSFAPRSRLAATVEPQAFDAFGKWHSARAEVFEDREFAFFALGLSLLALVGFALRNTPNWVAATLGIAVVPALVSLSSYYMGLLLAFACLAERYRDIGIALLLFASASWWGGRWGGPERDAVSALWSAEILIFVGYCAARVVSRKRSM